MFNYLDEVAKILCRTKIIITVFKKNKTLLLETLSINR